MKKRSPAIQPGYRKGQPPKNKGQIYPSRPFSDDEFMALFYGCSRTSAVGLRDRALLTTMYRSGIRVSEALALHVDDLEPDDHALLIRRGKGGKTRMAFMDDFGWEQMQIWLERRAKVKGLHGGWVFCTVSQPSPGGRLGSPQVRMMMKRKGEQAGLGRRCHPHALRHSFAVNLVNSGATLPQVSVLLGHSNVATTNTYIAHVDSSARVAAVQALPRPGGSVAPNQQTWQEQAIAAGWQQIDAPTNEREAA